MIALTLAALEFQRLGFDPNLGVDMHFFNKATADGKRIAALETVEFQLESLAGMNAAAEEAFLALTLQDLAQAPEVASAMVGLWRSGDAPGSNSCCSKPSTSTRNDHAGCWLSATGPGPGRSQT